MHAHILLGRTAPALFIHARTKSTATPNEDAVEQLYINIWYQKRIACK